MKDSKENLRRRGGSKLQLVQLHKNSSLPVGTSSQALRTVRELHSEEETLTT